MRSINNLLSRMRVFSNWHSVEIIRLGLRPAAGYVKTWGGLTIRVRDAIDLNALESVFVSRYYDQKECRIPKNGIILDIGAHIGAFSIYAAAVHKARRVLSCEPCPENFALLKENVENNKLSDVITCIAVAVGASNEARTLHLSDTNDSHSFYGKGKPIKVQCTTLKQLLNDNNIDKIDFLKINCEGGEYEILQNIDEPTANRIDIIGMTIHDQPRDWFGSCLHDLGFSVIDTREEKPEHFVFAKRNVSRILGC